MRFTGIILCVITFVLGCDRSPEYPAQPVIQFENIRRFVIKNPYTLSQTDSIIITVRFEDGDGDLGLSAQDTHYPYQAYDFVLDNDGNILKLSSSGGSESYNPCYYIIGNYAGINKGVDTFRVKYNPDHFNFFVDMWIKEGGSFRRYDTCYSPLNGRFPLLAPRNYEGPIDGELSLTISDQPWLAEILNGKIVKFQIYIQDRALHKSNVVETSEIQFRY